MTSPPSTLYSDTVLAHNRAPNHCGCLADATHRGDAENALCGDRLHVDLRVQGEQVTAAMFDGESCAITTASASMLMGALIGAPTDTAASLRAALVASFQGGAPAPGDFAAFAELRQHPARQRCALLPFDATRVALASGGSSALRIENARISDVADIVALVTSAYRGDASRAGWTTEADLLDGQRIDAEGVRELLERPDSRILLARRDAALAACIHVERQGETGYFGMFSVSPTLQGGGIGDALLAEAERVVRDDFGCATMTCTVISLRSELIAWYGRRGYRATGESKPFPYGDARFGLPKRDDLRFDVFAKALR